MVRQVPLETVFATVRFVYREVFRECSWEQYLWWVKERELGRRKIWSLCSCNRGFRSNHGMLGTWNDPSELSYLEARVMSSGVWAILRKELYPWVRLFAFAKTIPRKRDNCKSSVSNIQSETIHLRLGLKPSQNPVWDLNPWNVDLNFNKTLLGTLTHDRYLNPAKTHDFPTEITDLVSGPNEAHILDVSWKKKIQWETKW